MNNKNNNIVPITRINKFFSEEDFNLEISMGVESLGDGNFTVILYRVDRDMTEYDNVYGEASANGIRYFPPVELKVIPIMADPENKSYNPNGGLRYLQDGQLTFGIYDAQLTDLKTQISYGDYIGYQVTETEIRYFSVVNDGVKNYDNKHTIMGYKGAFRTIVCASIENNEFNGM
jgi:hypothetical protein